MNVNHHGQFDIADVKMSEIAAFTISTTPSAPPIRKPVSTYSKSREARDNRLARS